MTWLSLFLSFSLKLLAFLPSHVVLNPQRDIAHFQHDVIHAFSLFLPQIARFLAQPRRVGLPTRHGTLPTRRGDPLSTQKTTRAIRVAAYLLYLSSNVQSNLKLA